MFDWPEPTYAVVMMRGGRRVDGRIEQTTFEGVAFVVVHPVDGAPVAVAVTEIAYTEPTSKEALERWAREEPF